MKSTALYELRKNQTEFSKTHITSSGDSASFIRQFYQGDIEIYESFFLFRLQILHN